MPLSISYIDTSPFIFFFFNDTATTEIYTLSLHDALPISRRHARRGAGRDSGDCGRHGERRNDPGTRRAVAGDRAANDPGRAESEEHTSELPSPFNIVCRLLLVKKKKQST